MTSDVYHHAVRRVDRLLRRPEFFGRLLRVGWGELTESLAVLDAATDLAARLGLDRADPRVRVLVVGDGHSPRTGALFAMDTGWTVTSVDPLLRLPTGPHPRVERLTVLRGPLEHWPELRADIVVAPHSHAPVELTRAAARGGHVVAMPCCVPWPDGPGAVRTVSRACVAVDREVVVEAVPA